jgi:hypothetical protein
MTRESLRLSRPVLTSMDELIEHFHDMDTSVEEAHGILRTIGTGTNGGVRLHGIELLTRSDRVKIIRFLCQVGHEVAVHQSVKDHPALRQHARQTLVRNAIPQIDRFHFDDGPVEGQSPGETVCRFFASGRFDHRVHNAQDIKKLADFFEPYGHNFAILGFEVDFHRALTHLGLSDILVNRRAIAAIPTLYEFLGDMGWKKTSVGVLDNHASHNLTWRQWVLPESIQYDHNFVDVVRGESSQWLDALRHDLEQAEERVIEAASTLAQLCSIARHLLAVAQAL